MNTYRRNYALGTYLETSLPWGGYTRGRALCPDGKVRNLKRIAITADSFFSIPAAITYKGKTVAGYITVKDDAGTFPTEHSSPFPGRVEFVPYTYRKNGGLFD